MKDAIESSRLIYNPSNVMLSILLIFIQYLSLCFSIVSYLQYLVQYPSKNSWVILYHIVNATSQYVPDSCNTGNIFVYVIYFDWHLVYLTVLMHHCSLLLFILESVHLAAICDNNSYNNCTLNKIIAFTYVSDAKDIHWIMIHYSRSIYSHSCNNYPLTQINASAYVWDAADAI